MSNHFPASAHQPCLKPQGSSNRPILRHRHPSRPRDSKQVLDKGNIRNICTGQFSYLMAFIAFISLSLSYSSLPLHLRPSIFSKLTNLKLSSVFTGFQIEHPLLTCEYVKIVQTLTRLARAGF